MTAELRDLLSWGGGGADVVDGGVRTGRGAAGLDVSDTV